MRSPDEPSKLLLEAFSKRKKNGRLAAAKGFDGNCGTGAQPNRLRIMKYNRGALWDSRRLRSGSKKTAREQPVC
ncbi:hypothetical protein SAMN04244573_01633 [Azotobacter beijerinckii]|uniref:Uncharacterized protein n=2 Tax=Azotobacter beijerinckii TaxID=170623 RepID=A0A1H9G8V8_9GAMM|nr:hypothetical protein SAMN04244573_01633 [Azotobacter beijerinckii]